MGKRGPAPSRETGSKIQYHTRLFREHAGFLASRENAAKWLAQVIEDHPEYREWLDERREQEAAGG